MDISQRNYALQKMLAGIRPTIIFHAVTMH